MPHVFLNRPRQHAVWADKDDLAQQFSWEILGNMAYVIGGAIFIIGSVFFLPKYEQYEKEGSILFIVGTVLYVLVSSQDAIEVVVYGRSETKYNWSDYLDLTAAFCYILGSVLFIIGSVLFFPQIDQTIAGAWNFVAGSVFFIVGAVGNALQIFESPNKTTACYAQLVAVSYILGGMLFLTGSVPYSFTFEDEPDLDTLDRWNAIQFILGSIFYFVGGSLNIKRANVMADLTQQGMQQKEGEGHEETEM